MHIGSMVDTHLGTVALSLDKTGHGLTFQEETRMHFQGKISVITIIDEIKTREYIV